MHFPSFPTAVDKVVRIPLQLADDNLFLLVTDVAIPLLVALASISVAIVSVVIASQARNIARESERARLKSESDRELFEHQLRFDAALKDIFLGIAFRIEALRAHHSGVNANMLNLGRGGPGVIVPPSPPISSLLALIAAARLDARDSETLNLLKSVARHADYVAQTGGATPDPETREEWQRRTENEVDSWERLLTCLDDWRHSDSETRKAILRKIEQGKG